MLEHTLDRAVDAAAARIVETLAQIGRPQAFPAAMAEELAAAA